MPDNTNQAGAPIGVILNTPIAAGRVVVYGGGTTDPKRLRLRIIYSKI